MGISENFKDFQIGLDKPTVIRLAEALAAAAPNSRVIKGQSKALPGPPNAVLTGQYTSLEVAKDIHFFSCDMVFDTLFQTRGTLPSSLWVGALFSGAWHTRIDGLDVSLPADGTPRIIVNSERSQYLDQPTTQDRIRMASFLIGAHFFERAAQDDPNNHLGGLHRHFQNGLQMQVLPQAQGIRDNLLRLLNNPYRGTTAVIYMESLIMASLFSLAEQFPPQDHPVEIHSGERQLIAYEAKAMIDDAPEDFTSIVSLAQKLGSNESTLQRQFRKAFGTTIFDYVLRTRMQSAHVLVRDGHLSISEISYRVGYNSPANFSTAYKRYFGNSPVQDRLIQPN